MLVVILAVIVVAGGAVAVVLLTRGGETVGTSASTGRSAATTVGRTTATLPPTTGTSAVQKTTTTPTTAVPTSTTTRTYALGDTGPAGGLIFYDKGDGSGGWRYLEAAPASTDWAGIQWGPEGTAIPGAHGTAIGTGKQNTAAIVAVQGPGNTYAAQLCDGLASGGFDDWFLPSKEELSLLNGNLALRGLGGFETGDYWSSFEVDEDHAWILFMGGHDQFDSPKHSTDRVRAVRAF